MSIRLPTEKVQVIVLQTSIIEKSIKRIALHEPPILTNETKIGWIKKYEAAIGQVHTVSDNDGKPELVATELRRFF